MFIWGPRDQRGGLQSEEKEKVLRNTWPFELGREGHVGVGAESVADEGSRWAEVWKQTAGSVSNEQDSEANEHGSLTGVEARR